ncbi:hypothetical protein NKDENANG_03447 [Candidatus Entotheonellaceae bacterium PAL068K]
MRITKDNSEFEISICEVDGEWEGRMVEYHISRVTPTLHLRHSWMSLDLALAGVRRRWQRLFPEDDSPDFHAAIAPTPSPLDGERE